MQDELRCFSGPPSACARTLFGCMRQMLALCCEYFYSFIGDTSFRVIVQHQVYHPLNSQRTFIQRKLLTMSDDGRWDIYNHHYRHHCSRTTSATSVIESATALHNRLSILVAYIAVGSNTCTSRSQNDWLWNGNCIFRCPIVVVNQLDQLVSEIFSIIHRKIHRQPTREWERWQATNLLWFGEVSQWCTQWMVPLIYCWKDLPTILHQNLPIYAN